MANRTASKNNATRTSPVAEQGALETDWVEATSTTLSTQPTELNVDVTSTTTSLVSSSTLTQGQEVTLVESDNSYTDGVLGAVTLNGDPDGANNTSIIDDMPSMTTYTVNGYTVSASSELGGYEAWKAANDVIGLSYFITNATQTGWWKVALPSAKSYNKYTVTCDHADLPSRMMKDWTFEGSNDNTNWTVLDTVSAQTGWTDTEERIFTLNNSNTYLYYRFNVSANNGDTYMSVGEVEFIESGESYTADITSFSLATAPTKAFLKDDTSISLAIESTPERIVNEVSTYLTVLEDTTALLTDVDPFGDSSGIAGYTLNDGTDGLLSNLGTTGSYNATASNVTYTTGSGGKFGEAAIFNGTTSNINTGYTVGAISTFSYSAWIKTSDTTSNMAIIGDNDSGGTNNSARMSMYFNTVNSLAITMGNGVSNWISSSISASGIRDNNWHLITVTVDGTVVKVYFDGAIASTETSTVAAGTAGVYSYHIGRLGLYNGFYFNGTIDQVRFFTKALSATEVSTLYTEGQVGTDTTNLVVTEPIYEGEKLFIDDTEVTLGAVTGVGPYTVAHTLTATTPTKAYRKGSKALTVTGTPTGTEIMCTSATSGLLTTGDTILLDNNKPVVTTSVVESPAGTYTCQFLDISPSPAPTTVAVPDNTYKLPVVSKDYNDATNAFDYTYGSYVKGGRAMSTKLESTTSGTTVLANIVTNLNKAG